MNNKFDKENKTKKKYIELTEYEKIDIFLQEHDFFCGYEIYKIFNKDGNAEIIIKDEEQEIHFFLTNVDDFTMVYFTDEIYIDSICVNNVDGRYSLEIDDNGIYISAEKIRIKALDLDNTIYTYASIKYKEGQEKTFYYISNIENLKIGDYVWIPVRDTSCPGIVENIEEFSYKTVPFPVNRTKAIIRRSSKEEFDEYSSKKTNNFKEESSFYDDGFEFEERDTLRERVKKLPYIKSQKIEWERIKENDDNTITMPFPKYSQEIYNWIEVFHKLKLIDHNYIDNCNQYIKDKNIEDLSFEETLSYLSRIIRGERFCDGLIATNLENGVIEQLEKMLFSYLIDFTEITDDNISEITEENIMFFTLAESGAMGEPDGIEIITKTNTQIKLYHTNLQYFDIEKLYSIFSTLKTLHCELSGVVTGVQKGFVYINTGFGNHLFVNSLINDNFQEQIKDLYPAKIYSSWLRKGLDILNYDWSNINK